MIGTKSVCCIVYVAIAFSVCVNGEGTTPGEAYLWSHGITKLKRVLYYERMDNATGCLSSEDADSVLLQLCDARSVIEECVSKDETILYDTCTTHQCTGKFGRNHTRCLLEKSGLEDLGNGRFDLCSPPAVETGFFDWHTQAWALEAERRDVFDCIVAAPPKTKMEYRLACKRGRPILQHRIIFNDTKFLETKGGEVQCLGIHKCDGPKNFRAELACYVIDPNKTVQIEPDRVTGAIENGSYSEAVLDVTAKGNASMDDLETASIEGDEGSAARTEYYLWWLGAVLALILAV